MADLIRKVEFVPGFDRRNPDPSKNYGISGGRFMFVVSGPKGAVHFVFSASMYPASAVAHLCNHYCNDAAKVADSMKSMGFDVGYHAFEPQYEGQTPHKDCELLGADCYSDGSALRAQEWMEHFTREGTKWLWPALEAEYFERFGG